MIRRKMHFGLAEVFRVGGVCGLFYAGMTVLGGMIKGAALLSAFTTPVLVGIGIGIACMFIASAIKTHSEQAEKEREQDTTRVHEQSRSPALTPAVHMQPARTTENVIPSKSFVQDHINQRANSTGERQL